jgi:hypothetical protein
VVLDCLRIMPDHHRHPEIAMRGLGTVTTIGLILLAAACGPSSGSPPALEVSARDSVGVRIVELGDPATGALPEWRLAAGPDVRIGDGAGSPEYELFHPQAATVLEGGVIAIANAGTSEIRLYDRDGRHLRSLGRSGAGPGEFQWVAWVGAVGDTLVAFDSRLRRLTWFDTAGTVVRTQALGPAGGGGFPEAVGMLDDTFIARSGFDRTFGRGERRDTLVLYRYAADGTVADTLGRYPGEERYFLQAADFAMQFEPIYGRTAFAHAAADRVAVGATDTHAFDVHDANGLVLRVRANRAGTRVSARDIERERATRQGRGRGMPQHVQDELARAVADIPARETLPAFAALRVDRTGAIWVRDAALDADAPAWWTVYDADGTPRARALLPGGLHVHEIGADYVLGRTRDEDGVEVIARFPLRRSGG